MKRTLISLITSLLFVACTQGLEEDQLSHQDITPLPNLTATFDEATRTYVDKELSLFWHNGDLITAFFGKTLNQKYKFIGKTGANSGEFEHIASGNLSTGNKLDRIYAIYPYDDDTSISNNGVISFLLPDNQAYGENSFGRDANTMVSVTESVDDTFLIFKNACGYLKLKLYGDNITIGSITVRGNNDEKIAGATKIVATYDDIPTVTMSDNATSAITLNCGNGVTLNNDAQNPTEFWVVIPATTFSNGITIIVTDINGDTFEKSTNKAVVIERNIIQPMAAIEVEVEGGTITKPANNEIWYTSTDGKIVTPYKTNVFGATIESHTYENGKGVITFDGDVTQIGEKAFYDCQNLTSITYPDSITTIGAWAFYGCNRITSVTIPANVTMIGLEAFQGCTNLTKVINQSKNFSRIEQAPFRDCHNLTSLEGELVSDDHRCLVSEDGVLLLCVTAGLTEYTLPNNVQEVKHSALEYQNDIEKLTIPEGVTKFGNFAFANSDSLTEVTIPESITDTGSFTFSGCKKLSKLNIYNDIIGNYEFSNCFSLIDIVIPEQVTIIDDGAFCNCQGIRSITFHDNLKTIGAWAFDNCAITSITIPDSVDTIGDSAFSRCDKLMEFKGKFASGDKVCLINNGRLIQVANGIGKQLLDYTIPAEVTHIGDSVFSGYSNLNSITIPEGVVDIGIEAFTSCSNLIDITIPSTVTNIGTKAFFGCSRITAIYFRGSTPPQVYEGEYNKGLKTANDGTIIRVPDEYVDVYKSSFWGDYYAILGYTDDLYASTDYSEDGKVTVLNKATKGNGIDIVIMGDGYSDRQIAAGNYSSDINHAIELLFEEEPYKSFRDYFNVYMVTAVSVGEGYGYGPTAFGGYFGSGTRVGGNDRSVIKYAQNAISDDRMDNALLIVIMNREYYAGTCYMYYPSGQSDCGKGLSISYFPLGTDDSVLAGLIRHEAGGHGFAKLADEYAYQSMGTIPEYDVISFKEQTQNWGWWKNVDFTSDMYAVHWAKFVNDSRYASQKIGAYEGGLTYWSGVWRPTENSIMRHNTGGYNAPSREAIYYRIHKLAYGDEWSYDYETFVQWDTTQRTASPSKSYSWHAPMEYIQTTPPIIIEHSWRDAK